MCKPGVVAGAAALIIPLRLLATADADAAADVADTDVAAAAPPPLEPFGTP